MDNFKNINNFLSLKSIVGCLLLLFFFRSAAFAQTIYITDNTLLTNASEIHGATYQLNSATQNFQIIYAQENTIISGLNYFEVQKQKKTTRKQRQLSIVVPKAHVANAKAIQPYWFSKKQFQNKYTYQSLEVVTTIVTLTFKNSIKKILSKYNFSTQGVQLDQKNSIAAFYINIPKYQNSKTYTLLCYFPPPIIHNPDLSQPS